MLEILEDALGSYTIPLMDFHHEYDSTQDNLYCFFEGEDLKYYNVRVASLAIVDSIKGYDCKGKENVTKVYEVINNSVNYKNARVAFFVDADFDDNTRLHANQDIYVTPFHSLENFYIKKIVLEQVFSTEFKLKRHSDDYNICIDLYTSLKSNFMDAIFNLNVWIACQSKHRGLDLDLSLKIDKTLKDELKNIVSPDLKSVKQFENLQTINNIEFKFPKGAKITQQEFDKVRDELLLKNKTDIIRGKFLLSFLVSFLDRLQSIKGHPQNPFDKPISSGVQYTSKAIYSQLSNYAITPDCLRTYIASR